MQLLSLKNLHSWEKSAFWYIEVFLTQTHKASYRNAQIPCV